MQLTSMLYDAFVTGDGYLYIQKPNVQEIGEKLNEKIRGPSEYKSDIINEAIWEVKQENPDILAVWDVENEGWRSFRVDSVEYVQEIDGY